VIDRHDWRSSMISDEQKNLVISIHAKIIIQKLFPEAITKTPLDGINTNIITIDERIIKEAVNVSLSNKILNKSYKINPDKLAKTIMEVFPISVSENNMGLKNEMEKRLNLTLSYLCRTFIKDLREKQR
jgi:hypothetical protein